MSEPEPYADYPFRLKLDGRVVAGFRRATGLSPWERSKRRGKAVAGWARGQFLGSIPQPVEGVEPVVTLEHGRTRDPEFDAWIRGSEASDRHNLTIEIYDADGRRQGAHDLFDCWVARYQGARARRAGSRVIERLELACRGWDWSFGGPDAGWIGQCWKAGAVGLLLGGAIASGVLVPAVLRDQEPTTLVGPILSPTEAEPTTPSTPESPTPSFPLQPTMSPTISVPSPPSLPPASPRPAPPPGPAPPNEPPVAQGDRYENQENQTLAVSAPGVLGNDSDPDGDPIEATLRTSPDHGDLTLEPDGSFTYSPDPRFVGVDSFTYRAVDASRRSAPATVSISVNPSVGSPTVGTRAAGLVLLYSVLTGLLRIRERRSTQT